uniref:Uncharacterized protein n=1 Tax=Steinernema glaseri TaxID=37863 RepID=A0A1I7YGV1_9BILA
MTSEGLQYWLRKICISGPVIRLTCASSTLISTVETPRPRRPVLRRALSQWGSLLFGEINGHLDRNRDCG